MIRPYDVAGEHTLGTPAGQRRDNVTVQWCTLESALRMVWQEPVAKHPKLPGRVFSGGTHISRQGRQSVLTQWPHGALMVAPRLCLP